MASVVEMTIPVLQWHASKHVTMTSLVYVLTMSTIQHTPSALAYSIP